MIKGFCCLKLAQKPFTVLRSPLGEESPTDAFRRGRCGTGISVREEDNWHFCRLPHYPEAFLS